MKSLHFFAIHFLLMFHKEFMINFIASFVVDVKITYPIEHNSFEKGFVVCDVNRWGIDCYRVWDSIR